MRDLEETLDEYGVVSTLLRSVPKEFDALILLLQQKSDFKTMSHSCVMFAIHKFWCVHFHYEYFDHPMNDNLVESHTYIIFNSNNPNFMSCLCIPNLKK